jgi:hypothetical protein
MGNGISFWAVLVIMIIVAAVASLITVSVTGNTVKENKNISNAGTYTKAEVDLMLNALKKELTPEEVSVSNLSCDVENLCEVNELSAQGAIKLSALSYADSPLRTDNAYVCVDKTGKLYRGTTSGCR